MFVPPAQVFPKFFLKYWDANSSFLRLCLKGLRRLIALFLLACQSPTPRTIGQRTLALLYGL